MWTTLKTAQDWAAYCVQTAKGLALLPDRINWGGGPDSYPCLVCTLFPPRPAGTDPKAYSAFVYEADCDELYAAAGRTVQDPDAPALPTQRGFNRWVAAQQLAVAHFLVETGICKPEQYEEKLLEMIEKVDGYHGDRKETLKAQMAAYEVSVLDSLGSP